MKSECFVVQTTLFMAYIFGVIDSASNARTYLPNVHGPQNIPNTGCPEKNEPYLI
jgi:hypothetical protein